eukprot:1004791-Pleurochrysis_carterae.AAC.1
MDTYLCPRQLTKTALPQQTSYPNISVDYAEALRCSLSRGPTPRCVALKATVRRDRDPEGAKTSGVVGMTEQGVA